MRIREYAHRFQIYCSRAEMEVMQKIIDHYLALPEFNGQENYVLTRWRGNPLRQKPEHTDLTGDVG